MLKLKLKRAMSFIITFVITVTLSVGTLNHSFEIHAMSQVETIISFGRSLIGSTDYNQLCQAFVKDCYEASGIYSSPTAQSAYEAYTRWCISKDSSNIPIGAVLYFNTSEFGHAAIYTGNNTMLHGVATVREEQISSYYWDRFLGWGWQAGVRPNGKNENDKTPPSITNISVTNVSINGYTVTCDVTDDYAIAYVTFPTWTLKEDENGNNQDDIVWTNGTISGNSVSCIVKTNDHNNETGLYLTHIYAYDVNGNCSSVAVPLVDIDNTGPKISEVEITSQDDTGYIVQCRVVSEKYALDRVEFPTWTLKQDELGNDQDDLVWGRGKCEGQIFSYRVDISDHNNETGLYLTHIYAFDVKGNYGCIDVPIVEIKPVLPIISDVEIIEQDTTGYTIKCNVDSKGLEIDRVEFPTWTTKTDDKGNDQDDIIWGKGINNGSTYSYRVNISEHNNELGDYRTHIYVFKTNGEYSSYTLPDITIEKTPPTISEVKIISKDDKGYTVQCKVVDNGSGLDRVEFPTWTLKTDSNGKDQDDMTWERGKTSDGIIFTYRVNISAHNNELGGYRTHIYAFDKCGNSESVAVPDVFIEKIIKGDANNDGEVTVADAVMLQKWLLGSSKDLTCWQNVDLCEDGKIDVFDMVMLRRLLVSKK